MALPKLLQKLFQNGGAGDKLNPDILPEIKKLMLGDHVLEFQKDGTLKLDGSLTIERYADDASTIQKFTRSTVSETPTTQQMRSWRCVDKNNAVVGDLRVVQATSGNTYSQVLARKIVNGTQIDSTLNVGVTSDGSPYFHCNGKEVERVNSGGQGSGYVRYESGLQLCYGDCSATTAGTLVTYAMPFVNQWCRVALSSSAGTDAESNMTATLLSAGKLTTTGFTAYSTRQKYCNYIAIGYWK